MPEGITTNLLNDSIQPKITVEKTLSHYLDSVGAIASSACAIHCLLTPLVIGLLPLLGIGFLAAPWFENTAVFLAIGLGLTSLIHGYSHHRQFRVFWLLFLGIALLISGRWVLGNSYQPWETLLVVAGGLGVATAHLVNRRLCLTCSACHTHH